MRLINSLLFIATAFVTQAMPTAVLADTQEYKDCLIGAIEVADDNVTLGDLRAKCDVQDQPDHSLVSDRIKQDKRNTLEPFTILSHEQNYLLLANHNSKGYQNSLDDAFAEFDDRRLDDTEAQFQLSIKAPLETNIFNRDIDLYGSYTVRSFWQIFNDDESRPFRETNHEPELWLQAYPNWRIFGLNNAVVRLGINHQSNGRPDPISRSWNRVFVDFILAKDNFALSLKPWIRISEDEDDDDNPDITDFLGHYEIKGLYKSRSGHQFSLMSRNNLESGFERGSIEAGWSFPLGRWPYLRGYVQYFRGYGESLLDYNEKANSIGLGIMLK